jgi:hypothetical protein
MLHLFMETSRGLSRDAASQHKCDVRSVVENANTVTSQNRDVLLPIMHPRTNLYLCNVIRMAVQSDAPATGSGRGSSHRAGDGRRARAYPVRLLTGRVGDSNCSRCRLSLWIVASKTVIRSRLLSRRGPLQASACSNNSKYLSGLKSTAVWPMSPIWITCTVRPKSFS